MNVVVTGGGTIAPIDDVRHLANVSSGRFSAQITEAWLARGATVWHIHTPSAQLPFWRAAGFDLVGFKLLSRTTPAELIRQAEAACRTNRADLTVANDLQTLRAGRHTVHLVRPGHPPETLGPGADLAERLVERIAAWSAA